MCPCAFPQFLIEIRTTYDTSSITFVEKSIPMLN